MTSQSHDQGATTHSILSNQPFCPPGPVAQPQNPPVSDGYPTRHREPRRRPPAQYGHQVPIPEPCVIGTGVRGNRAGKHPQNVINSMIHAFGTSGHHHPSRQGNVHMMTPRPIRGNSGQPKMHQPRRQRGAGPEKPSTLPPFTRLETHSNTPSRPSPGGDQTSICGRPPPR